jgi:hypothetical protein
MTLVNEREYRSPNRRHDRAFFYKYVTAQVAKIVLISRKLRWSSPLLFNDPFDVTQELRLNFDDATLRAALTDRMASLIEQGDLSTVKDPTLLVVLRAMVGTTPDTRRAMAHKLRQRMATLALGPIQSLADLKDLWKKMVPTFRVLCLSELNDITPMWLHYADSYKGVVLQFSAVDELDSTFLMARPVIYEDAPPPIADPNTWVSCLLSQDLRDFWSLFIEHQHYKTNAWAYEKEWRIASGARPGETGLFGEYGFHSRELTDIYLGPKCSAEDRSDILALLTHGLEHVRAYEPFLDIHKGKFTFHGIRP